MKNIRKVARAVKGYDTKDGAGVKLTRVLSNDTIEDYDPFLMLDSFDSKNPDDYMAGFPWHPHRGIETITYLISGNMIHEDTLGNKGKITSGGSQWMNSGSGIKHQEMMEKSDHMLGFQLWLNLPQKDKFSSPSYNDILSEDVPVIEEDGKTVRIISGEYGSKKGFTPDHIQARILDVELKSGSSISVDVPLENNIFAFLIIGDTEIDGIKYEEKTAVLFGDGDFVEISANSGDVRFILIEGKPLHEPVVWGGPIVMNTKEELREAFDELRNDTFIKDKPEHHEF